MQQFDHLWRVVQDVEKKLIMYHALFGDEQSTTKLVAIVGVGLSIGTIGHWLNMSCRL